MPLHCNEMNQSRYTIDSWDKNEVPVAVVARKRPVCTMQKSSKIAAIFADIGRHLKKKQHGRWRQPFCFVVVWCRCRWFQTSSSNAKSSKIEVSLQVSPISTVIFEHIYKKKKRRRKRKEKRLQRSRNEDVSHFVLFFYGFFGVVGVRSSVVDQTSSSTWRCGTRSRCAVWNATSGSCWPAVRPRTRPSGCRPCDTSATACATPSVPPTSTTTSTTNRSVHRNRQQPSFIGL